MDPFNFPLCTPRKNYFLLTLPPLLLFCRESVPLHRQPTACWLYLGHYSTSEPPLFCTNFSTVSSTGNPTSSTFAKWYISPAIPLCYSFLPGGNFQKGSIVHICCLYWLTSLFASALTAMWLMLQTSMQTILAKIPGEPMTAQTENLREKHMPTPVLRLALAGRLSF